MKYKYDEESDVLAIFLSEEPYVYAKEMGDIVVHFDKKDKPVYLEFLNAHNFVRGITRSLPKKSQQRIFERT